MIEATAPTHPLVRIATDSAATFVRTTTVLDAIADAYTIGDAPHAEHLFAQALDDGLPWDQVCAAAARGVAQHFGERDRV